MGLWSDIKWNLANIFNIKGRQSLSQFWPYAGLVIVLGMAVGMAAMVPEFLSTFERMHQFAIEHPDQATVESGPGHYSVQIEGHHPELMPDFGAFILVMAGSIAVQVALLAAAVIRRLHDVGRSGFIALPLLFFLGTGLYFMSKLFAEPNDNFGQFFLMMANNMLYLGSLGFLVWKLATAGDVSDNRFGPKPPAPWQ